MRKKAVIFILAVLAILAISLVFAESNETNNTNGNNDLNETGNITEGNNETEDTGGQVTIVKTRTNKTTFSPWQKRNESECPEGCKCTGAVVSCPTETGKTMTITAGRSGNTIVITFNKIAVNTSLEIEEEIEGNKTQLKAKTENGQFREIKIMPDTASEKAIERLRLKVCSAENNCTIELKETGNQLAYEVQAQKEARILGLFKTRMNVQAQVDAENGDVKTKKPWWAFLALQ